MSPITTHVLDTSTGRPAKGLPIRLSKRKSSGEHELLASGRTDDDGRIKDLLDPGSLVKGVYSMFFDTGAYFKESSSEGFYPEAVITFEVKALNEHYHIALLLSNYGYSTYRGS